MSSYNERDDFTLVVRVFDLNIKNKLTAIENHSNHTKPLATTPTGSGNGGSVDFIEETFDYDLCDENDEERDSLEQTLDSNYSSLISTSITRTNSETRKSTAVDKTKREDLPASLLFDQNGRVIPYVKFDQLEKLLESNECKDLFETFANDLVDLDLERINHF